MNTMKPYERADTPPRAEEKASFTFPVVEERVEVGKQKVFTARVHVATEERTERHEVEAELSTEWVEVERVPRDELLNKAPEPRMEGDTLVLPVAEEELFIEPRWRLKEEVHVRQRRGTRHETVPVEVQRRDVIVEREAADHSEDRRDL
jgi:stress response protein YsnF